MTSKHLHVYLPPTYRLLQIRYDFSYIKFTCQNIFRIFTNILIIIIIRANKDCLTIKINRESFKNTHDYNRRIVSHNKIKIIGHQYMGSIFKVLKMTLDEIIDIYIKN